MKGKVLGFDAASGTGAITGEDGNRYKFTAADNKSPAPLKANDAVDFEVAEGAAKEIYATKTGFNIGGGGAAPGAAPNVDLSAMAANPMVANILAKPNVIWAAIIILGSLIGGYISAIELIGGGPMGILGFAGFILSLLFLIPVAAAVLVFFELTNNAMTPLARLVTMALAIGGPILLPILAGMVLGVSSGLGGMFGSMGLVGFHIDAGVIITVGGGVLMLLTFLGIIKKLG